MSIFHFCNLTFHWKENKDVLYSFIILKRNSTGFFNYGKQGYFLYENFFKDVIFFFEGAPHVIIQGYIGISHDTSACNGWVGYGGSLDLARERTPLLTHHQNILK